MSLSLPDIDLTGVVVGQSGFLSFQNAGVSADPSFTKNMPKLHFHNESGSGLRITFQLSGDTFTLPAGAWKKQMLIPGESGYSWQVLYNLPNPPVTTLFTDYYYPNEPIPEGGVLGNSPIGIGGTIAVTNVSSLSNETTTVKTLIIDIGLVGNTLLYQLFSDGSATWSVINGGVAHTVIQVQNAGNELLLGKAGDTTEVLGKLLVDQQLTGSGLATFNGGLLSNSGITVNGGSSTFNVATTFNANADATGNDVTATNFRLVTPGSFFGSVGSMSRWNTGTFSSTGAAQSITHGLGASPTCVLMECSDTAPSTATHGAYNYGATTFTAFVAVAGVTMRWYAWRS